MTEEDIGKGRENLFPRHWSRGHVAGHHHCSNGVLVLDGILILDLGLIWTLILNLILRLGDLDRGLRFLSSRQWMVDEDAGLFISRTFDTSLDASGAFWLLFIALFARIVRFNAQRQSSRGPNGP